jgi:hypothetical protein
MKTVYDSTKDVISLTPLKMGMTSIIRCGYSSSKETKSIIIYEAID